ncbi:MAG: hypothetical protein R6U63_06795 [Longimicrobiales bacterium]
MRRLLQALFLGVPMVIIVLAALIPMPLQWSMGGMIFGLLFFQLALVGSFDALLPDTRVYLALREETDQLLELVRELNAAAIEAQRAGMDPNEHTRPIVEQLHQTVERLPEYAGKSADGRLHLTPLTARQVDPTDPVQH